jgi:DNA repair exonuclease SbcCD nuclease subunit
MKILNFADLHLHDYKDFATYTEEGYNLRLLYGVSILEQIAKIIDEKQIDIVTFSGDFFHKKSYLYVPVINFAIKYVTMIAAKVPFVAIPGNHDLHGGTTSEHALNMFRSIPNVTILENESVILNGVSIFGHFIPVKEIPQVNADIFLGHGFVNGAQLASGLRVEGGYEKDFLEQVSKWAFIGDIHKQQFFDNRVFIPGSPLAHDFGDVGDQKGVCILDTEANTVEFMPLEAPSFIDKKYPDEIAMDNTGDTYNYYRIDCTQPIEPSERRKLKELYPNSHINAPTAISKNKASRLILAGQETQQEIVNKYLNLVYKNIDKEKKDVILNVTMELLRNANA